MESSRSLSWPSYAIALPAVRTKSVEIGPRVVKGSFSVAPKGCEWFGLPTVTAEFVRVGVSSGYLHGHTFVEKAMITLVLTND